MLGNGGLRFTTRFMLHQCKVARRRALLSAMSSFRDSQRFVSLLSSLAWRSSCMAPCQKQQHDISCDDFQGTNLNNATHR